eukprot:scaffold19696_cov128-Isochrysis_galbana.AAC.8
MGEGRGSVRTAGGQRSPAMSPLCLTPIRSEKVLCTTVTSSRDSHLSGRSGSILGGGWCLLSHNGWDSIPSLDREV